MNYLFSAVMGALLVYLLNSEPLAKFIGVPLWAFVFVVGNLSLDRPKVKQRNLEEVPENYDWNNYDRDYDEWSLAKNQTISFKYWVIYRNYMKDPIFASLATKEIMTPEQYNHWKSQQMQNSIAESAKRCAELAQTILMDQSHPLHDQLKVVVDKMLLATDKPTQPLAAEFKEEVKQDKYEVSQEKLRAELGLPVVPKAAEPSKLGLPWAANWVNTKGAETGRTDDQAYTKAVEVAQQLSLSQDPVKIETIYAESRPFYAFKLQVPVLKLHPNAVMPMYAKDDLDNAGCELCALEGGQIAPGHRARIATGIAMAIPRGYKGMLREKSGRALNFGLRIGGGVIDCNYRDDVSIILFNHSAVTFKWEAGEKLAQIMIEPDLKVQWSEIDKLPESGRGSGGFGSTGKFNYPIQIMEIDRSGQDVGVKICSSDTDLPQFYRVIEPK